MVTMRVVALPPWIGSAAGRGLEELATNACPSVGGRAAGGTDHAPSPPSVPSAAPAARSPWVRGLAKASR